MKKLNLDQKQMLKMLSVSIVADPMFVKNCIIKNIGTHHLKPNNQELCDMLSEVFDDINTRENFDTYHQDLKVLFDKIKYSDAKVILNSTLEDYLKRNA